MVKKRVLACGTLEMMAWSILLATQLMKQSMAAELMTAVGSSQSPSIVRAFDIPPGSLTQGINTFALKAGIVIAFDPSLTNGKSTPGLSGTYDVNEGFKILMRGSGLTAISDQRGGFQLEKLPDVSGNPSLPLDIELKAVNVRAQRFYEVGPLPGLGLTKEEFPGNVQSISAKEIKETHALSIADLMNQRLQSVNVNDYQGNPFQMDVTYRGFTASPQIGTPQGLSVFLDGIRVNEPFGDVVNWDMIPMNALSGVDVFPGSNPIFGLGTLGGAFAMKTKDGFSSPGVDAEILTGSFGRKQLQVSGGWNNGTVGLFGAGNFFLEDGWRENSPSRVNQAFGKASYRGEKLDLNFSTLLVQTKLVGNGLVPSEQYREDREGVYTSPDTTKNDLLQFQLSGSYFVNDNFSITTQVYRRDSKRSSLGADVYTEGYEGENSTLRRNLISGEQYTCLFTSTNQYGLPNYYVLDAPNGDIFNTPFIQNYFASDTGDGILHANLSLLGPGSFNQTLDPEYAKFAKASFDYTKNFYNTVQFGSQNNAFPVPIGPSNAVFDGFVLGSLRNIPQAGQVEPFSGLSFQYTAADGTTQKYLLFVAPVNKDNCFGGADNGIDINGTQADLKVKQNGLAVPIDGANDIGGKGPGLVKGVPTGVLTNTQINQITDGASVQLNWNFEKHKFMMGASIDAPSASYTNTQRLGLIDSNRKVFLAPDQINDQFAAADVDISNNNFSGKGLTKSFYASETWTPVQDWHFTGAVRYNETHVKNTIAVRDLGSSGFNLANYIAFPNAYDVIVNGIIPPTGYVVPDTSRLLNKPETEKFSYYSLNPSIGATWQATKDLNLYANLAQGARTPSVVELGCALDHTLVPVGGGKFLEKSLAEGRSCSLPSTLSGDPHLPQIKALTLDLGMRGQWGENVEWNLGAYRTDLRNDIYLVTLPGNRSFFDSIGNTRRQGIEAGVNAAFGKAKLRVNYAFTQATFEDTFKIVGAGNSSAQLDDLILNELASRTTVSPGARMPGVPLHNLNATFSYELTPKWQMSLTGIAHSSAFLRGNENNKHQENVSTLVDGLLRPSKNNPGTVDGYIVFNFRTSYRLDNEWRLGFQVNNIFDKEYFSAGRLGVNPFSPSIYGAIGPDGYNHNSNDWVNTNFLAPGAPRGAWLSLSYEFSPKK